MTAKHTVCSKNLTIFWENLLINKYGIKKTETECYINKQTVWLSHTETLVFPKGLIHYSSTTPLIYNTLYLDLYLDGVKSSIHVLNESDSLRDKLDRFDPCMC